MKKSLLQLSKAQSDVLKRLIFSIQHAKTQIPNKNICLLSHKTRKPANCRTHNGIPAAAAAAADNEY